MIEPRISAAQHAIGCLSALHFRQLLDRLSISALAIVDSEGGCVEAGRLAAVYVEFFTFCAAPNASCFLRHGGQSAWF